MKKLERIKMSLLHTANPCPVCKSEVKQQRKFERYGSRYHLTDCICSNCGVRIAKYKFPIKIIEQTCYAIAKVGGTTYAIDPVGRTYQVKQETKTATYMSGEMGQPGHEYTSDYAVDTLHWVGLIEEFWSKPLW